MARHDLILTGREFRLWMAHGSAVVERKGGRDLQGNQRWNQVRVGTAEGPPTRIVLTDLAQAVQRNRKRRRRARRRVKAQAGGGAS